MTIEEILAGESKNVEFKVQRPKDSIKYMKTVIAFSNGEGGRIVFGVDDDTREVVGIPKENVFSEIDAITTAISDSCEPVVIPDVYLQTIEDKTIIIAEISPGKQRPYYIKSMGIKDGTYIRVSGTSRPAGRDLTAEMYYEDEGRSYDKVIRRDLTVTDEEIAELCRQMKEVAIANGKSKTQKEDGILKIQGVLLTWIAEDVGLFPKISRWLQPDDFFEEPYHTIAGMLYEQARTGEISPAQIISYFESKEEQSLAAGIFNKQVQQVNEDSEREKALNEMVKTLKKASLDKKSREITDLSQLQKIIMEKKQLETLHITLT